MRPRQRGPFRRVEAAAKQSKAKQTNAKQRKAKRSKAKQSKAKRAKTAEARPTLSSTAEHIADPERRFARTKRRARAAAAAAQLRCTAQRGRPASARARQRARAERGDGAAARRGEARRGAASGGSARSSELEDRARAASARMSALRALRATRATRQGLARTAGVLRARTLTAAAAASGEGVRGLEGRRSNTAWPAARWAYSSSSSSKCAEAPALGLLATQHRAAASITGARAFSTGAGPSGGAGKKSSEDEKNAKKDAQNGTTTIAGVVQDAQNMASNVKDGAQNMASNVKDGAQNMASNVKDGAQAAMNTASDMRDGAQAAIDQVPVSRIKALIRDFGPVAIGVYGGIYVGTLGLLYGLVEADIVGAGDAISVLKSTGLNHFVDMDKINPRMGNFAVAWILTKFTEPPRLLLALAVTPRVARAIGWAPRKRDKDGNAVH